MKPSPVLVCAADNAPARFTSVATVATARRGRAPWQAAWLIALACIAGAAQADCANLQRLIEAGPDFEAIRGPALPKGGWRVDQPTPFGAQGCEMAQVRTAVGINCEGAELGDLETAVRHVNALTEQIRACVGTDWKPTKARLGASETTFFDLVSARVTVGAAVFPMVVDGKLSTSRFRWMLTVAGRPAAAASSGASGAASPAPAQADGTAGARSSGTTSGSTPSPAPSPAPATPAAPAASIVPVTPGDLAWRTQLDRFCKDLKDVIVEGKTLFAKIKGRPRGEGTWLSRRGIAGTEACQIDVLSDPDEPYLNCPAYRSEDKALVRGAALALRSDIQACLGPAWQVRDRTNKDRAKFVFVHADLEQTVEVTESRALGGVRLDVNAKD